MIRPRPSLRLSLLGLTLGLGLGCSLALKPRDDVETCDNVDECPVPEDNRYDPRCIREDTDIPGVCVAEFREDLSCDEDAYGLPEGGHPFAVAFDDFSGASRYDSKCTEADNQGAMGCPGPCKSGLSENANGVCDDDDPNTPPAVQASADLAGQDIRDQFCRSYFCDSKFVCDRSNESRPVCVPCDPDKPFGQGGCGDLYMGGMRSCIYQDDAALESACLAPDSAADKVAFGDCPVP